MRLKPSRLSVLDWIFIACLFVLAVPTGIAGGIAFAHAMGLGG